MRRAIALAVAGFANVVTFPLGAVRGSESKVIARDLLAPRTAVQTGRGRLLFDVASRRCFVRARDFNTSEPETLAWIDAMPDGACLWDIGANVGVFSLYAALVPGRRVLAFEPAASSLAILNLNIQLNHMCDRIAAYGLAFSGETKLDVLNMAKTSAGSSMHGFGTQIDQFGRTIATRFRQGAIGFSIDDFVATFSPPTPTHVKIDVDGIEACILRGGRDTLSAASVESVNVEVEGDLDSPRNREIMTLMAGLGFAARPKASAELRNVIFDRAPAAL